VKTSIFFLSLALVLSLTAFSQNEIVVDSLKKKIASAPDDSNKVNLYYSLARQYDQSHPKERVENLVNASQLAKKIKFRSGYKKITRSLISFLYNKEMYNLALEYGRQYMDFCEKNHVEEDRYNMAGILAAITVKLGKYDEALKYYNLKGKYDLDKENYKSYASVLAGKAQVYCDQGYYDSARVHALWAAEIFKRNNMSVEMAGALITASKTYLARNAKDMAEEKASEALELYSANGHRTGIMNSLGVLASVYASTGRTDSAFATWQKALAYADSLNSAPMLKESYAGLADLFSRTNVKESQEYDLLSDKYNDSLTARMMRARDLEYEMQSAFQQKENEYAQRQEEFKKRRKYVLFIAVFALLTMAAFNIFRRLTREPG
jgi:hypothetical protein